jgi:hypothetical protein
MKTMASAVLFDSQPFERMVRWRTVANVLSIGFIVLRCFQCKASSASRSFSRQGVALSYFRRAALDEGIERSEGFALRLGHPDLYNSRLAFGS